MGKIVQQYVLQFIYGSNYRSIYRRQLAHRNEFLIICRKARRAAASPLGVIVFCGRHAVTARLSVMHGTETALETGLDVRLRKPHTVTWTSTLNVSACPSMFLRTVVAGNAQQGCTNSSLHHRIHIPRVCRA